MTPEELARAKQLLEEGTPPAQVAPLLGYHYTTLLRKLSQAGYEIATTRTYHLVPMTRVELPSEASR